MLQFTRRFFYVEGHWGLKLPVWNIHATPVLMKRHILPPTPPHLFLLRKCGSRAAVGQKQIWGLDAGKGSESHISQREAIWVNAHLLMHTYRCKHKCAFPHTFAHIHVLLTGSDGWCAQNSPPLCDPLPPLHHLSVGLGGGPLTF